MKASFTLMLAALIAPILIATASASAAADTTTCSGEWQPCTDSKCCSSHSYQCYHKAEQRFAQCRPRNKNCVDGDGEDGWLCPGWQDRVGDVENGGNCWPDKRCRVGSGCYKRVGAEYAQCRSLPSDGACVDDPASSGWHCPGTWSACAEAGRQCTSSKCCAEAGEECYKRPFATFAMCRPAEAACQDNHAWLCPGSEGRSIGLGTWETCAEPWQKCLESGCCTAHNFGCYKRVGVEYAQCKPLRAPATSTSPPSTASQNASLECVPSAGWHCPGWQDCTEEYGDCATSKCCRDDDFGCYKRPFLSYAQCRPKAGDDAAACGQGWLCPGSWEQCSGAGDTCWESGCCHTPGFACYERRHGLAACLRVGECASQWPDGTCRVLTGAAGGGAGGDAGLAALEEHVEAVAIAVVLSVLAGVGLCCLVGAFVVRRYYWHVLEQLIAQRAEARAWRKGAARMVDDDRDGPSEPSKTGGEQQARTRAAATTTGAAGAAAAASGEEGAGGACEAAAATVELEQPVE